MRKKRILSQEHKDKIGEGNKKAHPKKLYDFVCQNCGVVFRTGCKNREYCSQKCYHESRLFIIECSLCGDKFETKTHNSKYCNKCRIRKCEYCGKEFNLNFGEIEGTVYNIPRKYCSQKCFHKADEGRIPWNKQEGINVICSICGKEFNVWKAREDTVKYCLLECKYEGQSRITNINHPLWKGGYNLYGKLLSENEGSFYRNRRIVLERDNYTCQYCGFKGESNYMDVHHIIKVRESGPSLPENMITLCRKCHNNADRGYISIEFLQEKVMV